MGVCGLICALLGFGFLGVEVVGCICFPSLLLVWVECCGGLSGGRIYPSTELFHALLMSFHVEFVYVHHDGEQW